MASPHPPYYSDNHVTLYHGDCREVLASMEGTWLGGTDAYTDKRAIAPRVIAMSLLGVTDSALDRLQLNKHATHDVEPIC